MPFGEQRYRQIQSEWRAIVDISAPSAARFDQVKREADELINAGKWTSGPSDLLSVIGRQRDELVHSRLIGWLLTPTGRHGLGRSFVTAFLDLLWPGEDLARSGPVVVETEVTGAGLDEQGRLREARADIVLHGNGVTIVIENKLDAGEQPDQCERLYWAWAGEPAETRWVFLTPTGRPPVTTTSDAARAGWRTMSYADVRGLVAFTIDVAQMSAAIGRATSIQYLTTLSNAVGAQA